MAYYIQINRLVVYVLLEIGDVKIVGSLPS